jgi:two-component system, chemotaxis family, CheB/CheR fusion protein
VRQELEPFGLERTKLNGSAVTLKPRQALSIGMILHELATNAVKYGALAVPQGHLEVNWSTSLDGTDGLDGHDGTGREKIILEWRECDGPESAEPTKRGFGLKLVDREVAYTLGGEVQVDFKPEGLIARIQFGTDS